MNEGAAQERYCASHTILTMRFCRRKIVTKLEGYAEEKYYNSQDKGTPRYMYKDNKDLEERKIIGPIQRIK